MKNLLLIRHAKSNWDCPVIDIDRSLSKRGIEDAHLVSANVQQFLPKTFFIYSSTAKRASATAVIFAQNIHFPVESILFNELLYTFDLKQFEKIIRTFDKSVESVILFGHNAAITDFVNKFGDVLVDNVPTSGLVSIEFDTDCWNKIERGKTKKILIPKDLKLIP